MAERESLAVEQIGLARDALAGRVAVVTGAGRGIGREIARAFAWLGAGVVIAELSDQGQETEAAIQASGGRVRFFGTDVSDPQAVAQLAQATREAFGPVDILVNNAIYCPAVPVLEMAVETWDRVMAVNLRGTFLTCKAFLPDMIARGSGTIVNLVSTDAMPHLSAYIASKKGIEAFSQSLAAEVGESGVCVIPFAPGFVDTPGLRSAAAGLAPALGMSAEQFLKLPIHPAYGDGAMPADHAAAATAYLVARLSDTYHGEPVNGYTVLERAGFIQPGAPAGESSSPAAPDAIQNGADLTQAIGLAKQLLKTIADTEVEFNQLPIFVRPLARSGFKSKSGQSVPDWIQTANTLTSQLKKMDAGDQTQQADARDALRAAFPRLKSLLEKLVVYYQEVPAETARFTKDAQVIEQVTRTSQERVARVRSLLSALEAVLE